MKESEYQVCNDLTCQHTTNLYSIGLGL